MSGFLSKWVDDRRDSNGQTQMAPRYASGPTVEPPTCSTIEPFGATVVKQETSHAEFNAATSSLNRAGVRMMILNGVPSIGVWSDSDGPEVRGALRILQMHKLPLRYLDGEEIPERYRTRRVDREPVRGVSLRRLNRTPSNPEASASAT